MSSVGSRPGAVIECGKSSIIRWLNEGPTRTLYHRYGNLIAIPHLDRKASIKQIFATVLPGLLLRVAAPSGWPSRARPRDRNQHRSVSRQLIEEIMASVEPRIAEQITRRPRYIETMGEASPLSVTRINRELWRRICIQFTSSHAGASTS
jgi:hypothetical protein